MKQLHPQKSACQPRRRRHVPGKPQQVDRHGQQHLRQCRPKHLCQQHGHQQKGPQTQKQELTMLSVSFFGFQENAFLTRKCSFVTSKTTLGRVQYSYDEASETVGRSVRCSRQRVGHGLSSSTATDPCTGILLSSGSCQRSLRHRNSEPARNSVAKSDACLLQLELAVIAHITVMPVFYSLSLL